MMEQNGEETQEGQQFTDQAPTKAQSLNRNKQVECKVCFRKMRSDTVKRHMQTHQELMECVVCVRKVHANLFKRHMLKHRKLHTLDENEMRDEIKWRKQSRENRTECELLIRQIGGEDVDDDEEEAPDMKQVDVDSSEGNEEVVYTTLINKVWG